MASMRTKETEARYQKVLATRTLAVCPLCSDAPIQDFVHWKIVENDFPYDLVATTHHMLVTKRHVTEGEITQEEWYEFNAIKHGYVAEKYEMLMEGMPRQKTIPAHFHVHLVVFKAQ